MRHRTVVIGGGSGGVSVAARLRQQLKHADIAMTEPSDRHFYRALT